MRILIAGSGGREHALARKLADSSDVEKIFVAPGNGGTEQVAENIDIAVSDIPALVDFARRENIDLVVPGPELPLTLGIVDAMQAAGIACFGPDRHCARLEGSKSFAKSVMQKAGVPTAACQVFTDAQKAREYIMQAPPGQVIKADGLAAGKGVVVAETREEALAAIRNMLEEAAFGEAGSKVVVEEKLTGEEVSLLCLCDGVHAVPLPSAQDHKAAYDNDQGPNTGGMGAYSPAPCLPDDELEAMADLVIRPVLRELAAQGHPFKGVLYAGLMLTPTGPKVLEYNVRFGDPECQPIMMRMESDLARHMLACVNGSLDREDIRYSPEPALGVVLAAAGYPGAYEKNMPISGMDAAESDQKVVVFHSGTTRKDGGLFSSGGRVLCVTARGADLAAAQASAYAAMNKISMPQSRFRKDIGNKGLKHLEKNGLQ